MLKLLLFTRNFILLLFIIVICDCKNYNGYSLYSATPLNQGHLQFLRNITKIFEVQYWRIPSNEFNPVEFMIGPKHRNQFIASADNFGLKVRTIIDDVDMAFDKQKPKSYVEGTPEQFSWDTFYEPEDIIKWLKDLVEKFPDKMSLIKIGRTTEERDILVVEINKPVNKDDKAPIVIVEAGIHGNEWISVSFATYLIQQLAYSDSATDLNLQSLASEYRWFIIPMANPDGFTYSHREDRLWRKNKKDYKNGIDLNRNFDDNFGKYSDEDDTEGDFYCGPRPFSEVETRALKLFIEQQAKDLKYYFSIHSYGQKIIVPYTGSNEFIFTMVSIAEDAASKMTKLNGAKYDVGTRNEIHGLERSGTSAGWVKKELKTEYVFTFVLRDNGSYGHAIQPENILPACQEAMEGIKEIILSSPKNYPQMALASVEKSLLTDKANIRKISLIFMIFPVALLFLK